MGFERGSKNCKILILMNFQFLSFFAIKTSLSSSIYRAILKNKLITKLTIPHVVNFVEHSQKRKISKNCNWEKEYYLFLKNIKKLNVNLIFPGHTDYPLNLLQLNNFPKILFFKGNIKLLKKDLLSVVGSRNIQVETSEWMNSHLLNFIQAERTSIISGGAIGVDILSHCLSVMAGEPTVVVLPTGINKIYPNILKKRMNLFLKKGGLIVTEYFPDQGVRKHFFVNRNRIIVGLGKKLFIAQASIKSGTMLSAKWAMELGKSISTLPGHPNSSYFTGSNSLIYDGAQMIRDIDDLRVWYRANEL